MAKKEKLYLRLYRRHDPDLLLLYHNKRFGFGKAVKAALRAYAKKEPFFMLPPPAEKFDDEWTSCQARVTLDTEADADIIDFLNTVKSQKINITVKSILRGSILGPFAYGEIDGKEYGSYNKKLNEEIMLAGMIPSEYVHEYETRNLEAASEQRGIIKERKKLKKEKEKEQAAEKKSTNQKAAKSKAKKAQKPNVNKQTIKKSSKKAKEDLYKERFNDEDEMIETADLDEDTELNTDEMDGYEETNANTGGNDFFAQLGNMLVS